MSEKNFRVSTIVLLSIVVILIGVQVFGQKASDENVQEILALMQDNAITSIQTIANYETTAYGNPDITRIAEQQLLATEAQMSLQGDAFTQLWLLGLLQAELLGYSPQSE